jgi:hypothetical protein
MISKKRAAAALAMLLTGCTKERLAGFTAASLVASYNVSLETAQRMLSAARQESLL